MHHLLTILQSINRHHLHHNHHIQVFYFYLFLFINFLGLKVYPVQFSAQTPYTTVTTFGNTNPAAQFMQTHSSEQYAYPAAQAPQMLPYQPVIYHAEIAQAHQIPYVSTTTQRHMIANAAPVDSEIMDVQMTTKEEFTVSSTSSTTSPPVMTAHPVASSSFQSLAVQQDAPLRASPLPEEMTSRSSSSDNKSNDLYTVAGSLKSFVRSWKSDREKKRQEVVHKLTYEGRLDPEGNLYYAIRVWKDETGKYFLYDCECDTRKPVSNLSKIKKHVRLHVTSDHRCKICSKQFPHHLAVRLH
jgi:hypothetical protein